MMYDDDMYSMQPRSCLVTHYHYVDDDDDDVDDVDDVDDYEDDVYEDEVSDDDMYTAYAPVYCDLSHNYTDDGAVIVMRWS